MREAGNAAIRQIERRAVQIEHGVVFAGERLDGARRDRPLAVQQWGRETADAVGIGGGLTEDVVVLGEQAQGDTGTWQHVGEAAHLHGQTIGAAPHGWCEIGPENHLHAGRCVGRPVARARDQRIEAGSGRCQRIGQRQRGVRPAVGLPLRDIGTALPHHPAVLLADPVGIPGLDRLAEPGIAHECHHVALRKPRQRQPHCGQVDRGHPERRGLATRQHEHPRVEVDARPAVGHGNGEGGVLDQAEPALARHAGAQHDARRGTGWQPGDADLIALPRHGGALHRRIQPYPVLGMEIVPPCRGHGEGDAGARRLGLGFGGDTAHQNARGAPGRIERLANRRIVRRPLGSSFQRLDRLGRAVQRLQRIGHDQQRWDLAWPGVGAGKILPGGLQRTGGLGWRAAHLGFRQRHPLCRRGIAEADPRFPGCGGGRPVLLADCSGGRLLRLAAALRRASGREVRGQAVRVCVAVGLQAGQAKFFPVGRAADDTEQHGQQQRETAHKGSPLRSTPAYGTTRRTTREIAVNSAAAPLRPAP